MRTTLEDRPCLLGQSCAALHMPWRVRLLSFFIVLAFAGLGYIYVRFYVTPKPHGVIVFFAPGLTLENLSRAMSSPDFPPSIMDHEAVASALFFSRMKDSNPIQDVSQLYSWISTNQRGAAGSLGLDTSGNAADNLFYKAQRSGRLIGLISSDRITHPVAASFYGHIHDANDRPRLARQLLDSTQINIILGGNRNELMMDEKRNLFEEAELSGYRLVSSPDELASVPRWRSRRLLGLFQYPDALHDPEGHTHTPPLIEMVKVAIECLQYNIGGYFLVVVHPATPLVSDYEEVNMEMLNAHVYQLNSALLAACDYAGKSSTVILVTTENLDLGWSILLQGRSDLGGMLSPESIHSFLENQF
ncbi:MAG: alkaline phosphatase [Candidatus Methylacidiphilales bacterium]